jgi:hypothetical protein
MHIPRIHDGDKVTYIGCCREQINWGNNDNPDNVLERGKEYTVERTEVHTAHTKLMIKGYNGKFNSICFLKGEEQ